MGVRGLIALKDGPEMEVEVVEEYHKIPLKDISGNIIKDKSGRIITEYVCTVKEIGKNDSESYDFSLLSFGSEWIFYLPTAPVPFTPGPPSGARGGSKKRTVQKGKKTRKMRRKA